MKDGSNSLPVLVGIKKDYFNLENQEAAKEEFIKDFIRLCRDLKRDAKADGRGMTSLYNKFVGICRESWQFTVYANEKEVWTEAVLFQFDYRQNPPADRSIRYPKTKWGDAGRTGRRWDSELREFLRREVMKQL